MSFDILQNRDHLRHLNSFLSVADQAACLAHVDRSISSISNQTACYDHDKVVIWSPRDVPPLNVISKLKHVQWSTKDVIIAEQDEPLVYQALEQLAMSNQLESLVIGPDYKQLFKEFLEALEKSSIGNSISVLKTLCWEHRQSHCKDYNSIPISFASFNRFVNLEELTIRCTGVDLSSLISSLQPSIKHLCITGTVEFGDDDGDCNWQHNEWEDAFEDPRFLPILETWSLPWVDCVPKSLMTTLIPFSQKSTSTSPLDQSMDQSCVRPIRCIRVRPHYGDGYYPSIEESLEIVNFVGLTALFVHVVYYSAFDKFSDSSLPYLRLFDLRFDEDQRYDRDCTLAPVIKFVAQRRGLEHLTICSPLGVDSDQVIEQFSKMSQLRYLNLELWSSMVKETKSLSDLIPAASFSNITCLQGAMKWTDLLVLLEACPGLRCIDIAANVDWLPVIAHFCPVIESITLNSLGEYDESLLELLQKRVDEYPVKHDSFSQLMLVSLQGSTQEWPVKILHQILSLLKHAPKLSLFLFPTVLNSLAEYLVVRDLVHLRELPNYECSFEASKLESTSLYLLESVPSGESALKRQKTDIQPEFQFVESVFIPKSQRTAWGESFLWNDICSVDHLDSILCKLSQPLSECDLILQTHAGDDGYFQFRQTVCPETGLTGREAYLVAAHYALSDPDKEMLETLDRLSKTACHKRDESSAL